MAKQKAKTVRPAAMRPRIYAWLIDGMLMGAVAAVLYNTLDGAVRIAIGLAVSCVYTVTLIAVWGQTLGKCLFHVRVVRYPSGERLSLGDSSIQVAALRWLTVAAGGLV